MGKTLKGKKPLPWWRRILLVLMLTAMAMLAALMLISYVAERQLGAEIVKVSQAGEPITFADLQDKLEPNSTGEDAARYYVEALSSIGTDGLEILERINTFYRKNITSLPAEQFPEKVREKVTNNLANVQPVLEKFDKGASLPLSGFDIGIEQGREVYMTVLSHVRTAVFLLSLRTLDLTLRGEDDAAVSSVISMLKMMRIFDSQPTMQVYAAKTIFLALACQDIRLLLERGCSSEESLAKLHKVLLETIPADVLERMFLAERVYQIEVARNLIPKDITSRFLPDKVPDLPERIPLPASCWVRLRIRQGSVRYLRDMAWLITASRRPWPEPLDVIAGNASESTEKSSRLISSGATFTRSTGEILALVRCSTVAIAIERYRRCHSELPGSLDDILGTYIDSIPSDPFTGEKLLYSYDVKSYVVYSVGINRKDDGGTFRPKANEKSPPDRGLRIRLREPE